MPSHTKVGSAWPNRGLVVTPLKVIYIYFDGSCCLHAGKASDTILMGRAVLAAGRRLIRWISSSSGPAAPMESGRASPVVRRR